MIEEARNLLTKTAWRLRPCRFSDLISLKEIPECQRDSIVIEPFAEFGGNITVGIFFKPFEFLRFVSDREEDPRTSVQRILHPDSRVEQEAPVGLRLRCKGISHPALQERREFPGTCQQEPEIGEYRISVFS